MIHATFSGSGFDPTGSYSFQIANRSQNAGPVTVKANGDASAGIDVPYTGTPASSLSLEIVMSADGSVVVGPTNTKVTVTSCNTPKPKVIGTASRSCASGVVSGKVTATNLPGANASGHYQGLVFLTDSGGTTTLAQGNSNASGDVTLKFKTKVATTTNSVALRVSSPTGGEFSLPVRITLATCESEPTGGTTTTGTTGTGGALANTGARVGGQVGIAAGLLLLGFGLVTLGRRHSVRGKHLQ